MLVYAREHAPTVADPKLVARFLGYLTPYWGDKKVSSIKGATCRKFAEGKSPAIARRSLETLRAAVNYFHKEYGLDPLPAFTMPPKHSARERWLTRDEAARLLWAAMGWRKGKDGIVHRVAPEQRTPHLARFILIGLYTGTRSGAILGLKWLPAIDSGWIDLDAGVMHRSGAGQRKTKKRQPPVKLPARLAAHLRRWKNSDGPIRHVVNWNGAAVQSIKKAFRSARKNASLSDDVIPHTLRHTAVTWLMQAGVDVWQVAGFVGMTVEMIERTYGHHHVDYQKRASGAIVRQHG